jgi:acetyl-CoA carboxylase carboxyltransferase component
VTWEREVEEIERRRAGATALGGPEAVERQHARGRLTVRERIEALVDPGSLRELGGIAGAPQDDGGFRPANYVLALARIGGRPCVVGGEDFTQRGGSPSPAGLRKSVFAEELACRQRVPLVRLLEGGGGSVAGTGGRESRPPPEPVAPGHRFSSIARILDTAPVVSVALGAVAGFPAARLAASHFSIMTRDTSQVLIGGPALVERALGEQKSKEELGGAAVHLASGVVDNAAGDEHDAMGLVRRFLSYLPTNVSELPPFVDGGDPRDRCDEELLEVVPRERRRVYDMRRLLRRVLDRDSLFELRPGYGRSQITALARLGGFAVGVWANDPRIYAGALDAEGAQKVRRFLELCDRFQLPVACFVDEPGFMIGSRAEAAGTIRYGVDAILAAVRTRVPWVSVIVRKAYGVAAAAHFAPGSAVLSWPSAESGALPVEGGVAVAFRREIAAAPDPERRRAELEEAFAKRRSAFPRAEAFGVHDLIDPRRTRPLLCQWIEWWQPRLRALAAGSAR